MELLFLGGTQFVGRHMVEAAQAAGHTITLFNRGRTNPDLFSDVEQLRGDRDGELDALRGRRWDAVLDINAYIPRHVRLTAELLRHSVERYLFVSTVSVYDVAQMPAGCRENGPLQRLEDPTVEEVTGETYGGLKVECEETADEIMPGRVLHLRPGIVAGPHDPTDRVTYYATRATRGGEMAVPGGPERPVQFIDARDLAAFAIHALEKGLTGIYNATGDVQTWGDFVEACAVAADTPVVPRWIDDAGRTREILEDAEMELRPGGPLPMAVPPEMDNLFRISSERAKRDGLVLRSIEKTLRDTIAWDADRPADEARRAGMTAEQEKVLLDRWTA